MGKEIQCRSWVHQQQKCKRASSHQEIRSKDENGHDKLPEVTKKAQCKPPFLRPLNHSSSLLQNGEPLTTS